jgi:hypothetical protein
LLDGVWGQAAEIDERTVDVHVGRLRKALSRGRDPIRSEPCAAPATPSTKPSANPEVAPQGLALNPFARLATASAGLAA